MVDFVPKRLQVFVSSTFSDLQRERQAAVEAILVAGHIPAGMELFTSGDESQMEVINQWIDESDVYLLILGGRYGSIEPKSGKSYTHLEYEYAVEMGKPLFACVINEAALETRVKLHGSSVLETSEPTKLREFRSLVLSRMSRFWDDQKDIKISVGETLAHLSRRVELTGWVRASSKVDMAALADEIARLSRENARLREHATSSQVEPTIQGLSFNDLEELLTAKGLLDFFYESRTDLVDNLGVPNDDKNRCKELELLGLVTGNGRFHDYFGLTEAGKSFLNKYALKQLRAESRQGQNEASK